MQIKFPKHIQQVINDIKTNGYEAYVVGGYIRDFILGKESYDIDITTNATPNELLKIIGKYNPDKNFINFGNIKFNVNKYNVEITTFRKEYNYVNHRKPEKIEYTNILEEDLVRRDFTINAICSDGEKTIDLFGGISDLNNKIIRTIGDSSVRLEEDALRILRAMRFASKYKFELDYNVKIAITNNYKYLDDVSFHTKHKELKGILEGDNYFEIISEYKEILKDIFCLKNLCVNLLKNCTTIEEKEALFFYYSDININNKYLLSRDLKFDIDKVDLKNKLNKYGKHNIYNALYFRSNILDDNKKEFKLLEEIINNNECYNLKMLDINGDDLLNINIKNNKIGNSLNVLLKAVIENKCKNEKKELLEYFKNNILD